MQLAVDSIRTDGGTQSRAQINWLTVTDYAADIAEGATFPPVVVYFDGADYWLADGFHRLEAHKRLGLVEIAADVKQGTRRDAILYSVKANAIHGLRRTMADIERAVLMLKDDAEWSQWPQGKVAEVVGCSQATVSRIVARHPELSYSQNKIVTRNGQTYTQNTANIGKPASPVVVEATERAAQALSDWIAAVEDYAKDEPATPEPEPVAPSLSIVVPAPPEFRILHGDMREVMAAMEPGSIDVIITDPPYPREFVPLYGDLARLAARVLKPGGSLLAMAGQSYIPDLLALMTPHLRYHWMLSYMTLGGQSPQIWPRKINTFWKPVFWFVNGEYVGDWHGDVIKSTENDKRFHHWGQSESGMGALVEKFTAPSDVILDPFCGGGTTGKVALDLGRGFIGIDTDTAHIATTMRRMGEAYVAASQA